MQTLWDNFLGLPQDPRASLALAAVGLLLLVIFALLRHRSGRKQIQSDPLLVSDTARQIAIEVQRYTNLRFGLLPASERRATDASRVMVYVDFPNFNINWRSRFKTEIDWPALPDALLSILSSMPQLKNERLLFRGAHVYDSFIPYDLLALNGVSLSEARQRYFYSQRAFLEADLAGVAGYFVHVFNRTIKGSAHNPERTADGLIKSEEKGVDTSIVTDMLVHASNDVYDIAVLFSDDSDYVPAVTAAQNHFNKRIIHAGFRTYPRGISGATWDEILIDHTVGKRLQKKQAFFRGIASQQNQSEDETLSVAAVVDRASQSRTDQPVIHEIYAGKVANVTDYGAFVDFSGDFGTITGLVHKSNLTNGRILDISQVVHVGQEVYVQVSDFNSKGQPQLVMKTVDQKTGKLIATFDES